MDPVVQHFLATSKAYAAALASFLVGITGVLTGFVELPSWVPVVVAVVVWFATWSAPKNLEPDNSQDG